MQKSIRLRRSFYDVWRKIIRAHQSSRIVLVAVIKPSSVSCLSRFVWTEFFRYFRLAALSSPKMFCATQPAVCSALIKFPALRNLRRLEQNIAYVNCWPSYGVCPHVKYKISRGVLHSCCHFNVWITRTGAKEFYSFWRGTFNADVTTKRSFARSERLFIWPVN